MISKYINWAELWDNEICLCIDDVNNYDDYLTEDKIKLLKYFIKENTLSIDYNECCLDGDNIIFSFSEEGGKNEGDSQGWFRNYVLTFDKDFMLIDIIYEQG